MPDFTRNGTVATSDKGNLKDLKIDDVQGNIVIFYSKEGNIAWPAGKWMTYFMDTEESAQAMKRGEIAYLVFVPGTLTARFNGYAMITDVWKKNRQGKGTEHIVGIADGHYDIEQNSIFLDNISVRPGWKRNTIASKLIEVTKDNFETKVHTHSKTTDDGYKFLKATGNLRRDDHGV